MANVTKPEVYKFIDARKENVIRVLREEKKVKIKEFQMSCIGYDFTKMMGMVKELAEEVEKCHASIKTDSDWRHYSRLDAIVTLSNVMTSDEACKEMMLGFVGDEFKETVAIRKNYDEQIKETREAFEGLKYSVKQTRKIEDVIKLLNDAGLDTSLLIKEEPTLPAVTFDKSKLRLELIGHGTANVVSDSK